MGIRTGGEILKKVVYLPAPKEDKDIVTHVTGPGGHDISVESFINLTKYGCAQCSSDIMMEDADTMTWTFNDDPICCDCSETNDLMGIKLGVQ